MKFAVLFISIFISNAHAEGDPTKFSQAIELAKSGRTQASQAVLSELVAAYPLNALYWFNLGQSFFSQENYTKAISAFRTVVSLQSPLTPAAQLFLARAYAKTGKEAEARRQISNLRKRDLPPNLSKEVELDSIEIENPALAPAVRYYRRKNYQAAVDALKDKTGNAADLIRGMSLAGLAEFEKAKASLANVKSDNLFEALSNQATEIFQKMEALVEREVSVTSLRLQLTPGYHSNVFGDGASEVKRDRFALVSAVNFDRLVHKGTHAEISAHYLAYWEEYPGLPNGRFLRQQVRADFDYPVLNGALTLAPVIEWHLLARENFIYQGGIQALYQKNDFGIDLDIKRNVPAHSIYEYMSGLSYGTSFFYEWKRLRLSYHFRGNAIGDLPLAAGETLPLRNWTHGPSLAYGNSFQSLQYAVALSYFFERYKNPSAVSNKIRRDDAFTFQAIVQHPIEKDFHAQFRVGLVSNDSTFEAGDPDDRDFSQFWFHMGVVWEIL